MSVTLKKEDILNAALKRFSHYGVMKTTMSEIADDVHITKANLYYYFSDKSTLLRELILEVSSGFYRKLERELADSKGQSLYDFLLLFLKFNREYQQQYCMVDIIEESNWVLDLGLEDISERVLEESRAYLTRRFQQSIDEGEIVADISAADLAKVYFNVIRGLSLKFNIVNVVNGMPNMENIDESFEQQVQMTNLIYHGLKSRN